MAAEIFDSMAAGMLWYDDRMRIVDANLAARRALDLDDGPLCVAPEDRRWSQQDERGEPVPIERRPVWRALHGEGPIEDAVVVVETPRSGQRWLRVNVVAVDALDEGRGPGAFVSFIDFTEERAAAGSLRDSEQVFRMFGEHSLDVIWVVDPRASRLLYINPAYERIWGRPASALFDDLTHWLDGVEPEDFARVAGAAVAQTETGAYEVEYRMVRPDGRAVWIRGRGFPLHGPDGHMRYMAGFAEDITQARESEALRGAHRLAQERLERIVATAPGAVHSYRRGPDGRGAFTFASPAIEALLGVAASVLMAGCVDLPDLVHPQDRAALQASLDLSAASGSAWLTTFRVPDTPAGERCVEAHSMPVREADGGVVWHGFFIDITERRQAEEQIRQLNLELEQRVADRTAELEAKHREMEAFTYSVSHDLKAPLRGIDGYSRLLESEHAAALEGEGSFFIDMIRKAARQMGELIDDLLAYSRIERGRPSIGVIAPAEIVAAVATSFVDEVREAALDLQLRVDDSLRVRGEREGLVLALRNLLDNAIKFTAGQDRREIEVGLRREGANGVFWVRDNGSGFDMRYHDRIFEIFQRLHRAEDYPGTGVGLAIVRKAVERMHGRVWARSAPGEGALFCIELPLADSAP